MNGTHYYRVPPPTVCHACKEQQIAQQGFKYDQPAALHWHTQRITRRQEVR